MESTQIFKKLEEIYLLLLSTQKEVLNLEELCAFTGLAKSTIYKLTMSGQIPFYKRSKLIYFDRQEIIDWLKSERGFNQAEIDQKAATIVTVGGSNDRL